MQRYQIITNDSISVVTCEGEDLVGLVKNEYFDTIKIIEDNFYDKLAQYIIASKLTDIVDPSLENLKKKFKPIRYSKFSLWYIGDEPQVSYIIEGKEHPAVIYRDEEEFYFTHQVPSYKCRAQKLITIN